MLKLAVIYYAVLNYHHNHFTALFPGPPRWAGARRELLDFMVQRKIHKGRHTDHPAGRHPIRTNQCSPPPSPHFLQAGCPSCHPTNNVKALKAMCCTKSTSLLVTCFFLLQYGVRCRLKKFVIFHVSFLDLLISTHDACRSFTVNTIISASTAVNH